MWAMGTVKVVDRDQMAETVQKSRIVSDDDNLEESLLEEFNLRLKNCMNQEEPTKNGDEAEEMYENVDVDVDPKPKTASEVFIQSEIEHYYDEPRKITNGELPQSSQQPPQPEPQQQQQQQEEVAVVEEAAAEEEENIYENVKTDQNTPTINLDEETYETVQENVYETIDEENKSSVKDRMFLSTDDASCLLFTQTVTSPMLTPSEENIDFLKGFSNESANTSDDSDSSKKLVIDEDAIVTDLDDKEVIYENVTSDGTVREQEVIYENLKLEPEPPKLENETVNLEVETLKSEPETVEEDKEDVYKNRESLKEFETLERDFDELIKLEERTKEIELLDEKVHETIPEDDETLELQKDIEKLEKTVASVNVLVKSDFKEKYSEYIHHNRIETSQNYLGKYSEVVSKNSKNIENREKDTETVPEKIVQNLKSQFSKTPEAKSDKKKELSDVNNLKNIDIMKQINKFEMQESGDGLKEDNTVTETYSETTTTTTTIEEVGQIGDKGMKKKKSKKSRKEEKENISVHDSDSENSDNLYNVNVKSLCRSFGDLSKVDNETYLTTRNVRQKYAERGRAKSLNDVSVNRTAKIIEGVFAGVCVSALKSSFNKFDALQKKNVLHVRSSDSVGAQDKFSGAQSDATNNCKACSKTVFQMEQIKAEKAIWHKNCFRCTECSKQLNVDTYESHEGNLYCKPHFKSLFAPKVVEEDDSVPRPRKNELIIRENQPEELPPDVVRASDKPDLGLEELHSLNVKERFQVFEHHQTESQEVEREPVNVKRSPSILSKLARFQAKGMDVGVADDSLNGVPIEESSSEGEEECDGEEVEGEDADLVRAKRVQKEKPFHFTGMSDVKNRWEKGDQNGRDERREERKQEIQNIRNRLFMGKQGKMKEMYQQAVMESESTVKKTSEKIDFDAKSIKDKFEKGEVLKDNLEKERDEEEEVYESEISKKSRSLFLELDANASKPPQISPVTPPRVEIRKAREAYLNKVSNEDTVKSTETVDDVQVKTADIQQRFKFFETYKEPEKEKRQFRITPPREGQIKAPTPEREVYRDPDVVRAEEYVEDSVIAQETHTATKMLNKFRQMEENLSKEPQPQGPKPLKRFTPPPEPARVESSSEGESGSEEEDEEQETVDNCVSQDLLEAQKAARAKQLRAKFEKWEAQEIRKEQTNIIEEYGDESQVESTRSLRARFENMRDTSQEIKTTPKVKVNRFVESNNQDLCQRCKMKVYPLEKISVHGQVFHKNCFKCMECNCVLRMNSYTYNQGLLYCIPHFKRLFISKGNYESGFGLDQHKDKWSPSPNTATMA
ncbi:F-actin-monooxygenase Mical isoform X4 [Aethina tumida]|uniref:F-actin-monooxygenase Mical isoform X4 n=1 Tax=Aethina tumida TaxID=116153 RepID=UPI0021495ACA|nr:F-actin-monooxygenase Mical isoform X4 [Aethina tumida]